jgi:TrmH family RNA methyltransferase
MSEPRSASRQEHASRASSARDAPDIRIVLIEPRHPGNIGAAARAMKTMGLERLVLVRPVDFPSLEAEQRAVSAVDVLERARVVEQLDDAVSDCTLIVGTTGRAREHPHPELDARDAGRLIAHEATSGAKTAVLFGCERDGLSNTALDACHYQLRIPTSDALTSLNLASAVQLVCYEIRMAIAAAAPAATPEAPLPVYPTRADLEIFYTRLREALDSHDYFHALNPTPTFTKIRRIFGRARPDDHELKLLHGLVKLMHRRD